LVIAQRPTRRDHLHGAWWPHSSDIDQELAPMLALVAARFGAVFGVMLNRDEWARGGRGRPPDADREDQDQLVRPDRSARVSQYSRFVMLRDHLAALRGSLPDGMADPVTLDAVADLLRVTRNSAGHPSGASIDEDTAYTHLQMGGRYLLKMTDLGAWLDARPAA
jgi:hypothetical protein